MQKQARRPMIQGAQEWLYVIIVASLSLYLVIGVLVWSWMLFVGIPAPGAFTTILAAIAGAMAGIVTPLQGPPGRRQEPDDETPAAKP